MRRILMLGVVILIFRLLCLIFQALEFFSVLLLVVWLLVLLYKGIQSILARKR